MFYCHSMFESLQVGSVHPPHLQPHTAKKKIGFIYDQNLYNQRVKVTKLRSRIYMYLKSHLISKDAQKNCCFACFRKLPERRLYWCSLKYLELSNLHQGYFLLPSILKNDSIAIASCELFANF